MLLYGESPQGLVDSRGLTMEEAQDTFHKVLSAMPQMEKVIEITNSFAEQQGYVETISGHVRRLPEATQNRNPALKSRAIRQCFNAVVQGSGAVCTNTALIYIRKAIRDYHLKSRIVITVHDSIVLDVHPSEINIVPKLALRWETDPEEPSITWYLREGVQFSDGVAFNAEAVKRNIEEYQSCSRSETSNIVECIVIDEFTVKMVLGHWDTSAIESIGTFIYFMSPEALDEYDVDTLSASTTSYGTGPFVISSFEPNVQITYERNENYWQEGLPYLDGVEIVYIGEASTLSAAFQSKDVDLIYSGNHDGSMDLMRVMAPQIESGDVVVETNTSGQLLVMNGLIPNSADPDSPWADARVRRALCYAIDREAIKVGNYKPVSISWLRCL